MPDDLPVNPAETQPSTHSSPARGVEHREWILGQVATMLSFYWQSDESDLVRAAAGKVWADQLERFTQAEIAEACRRWIGNESRRPTPAEIIRLCVEARPRPRVVALPYDPVTPEQIAANRAAHAESVSRIEDLLRQKGFGQIVKRIQRSGEE